MNVKAFNALPKEGATTQLAACCGSAKWQEGMLAMIPVEDELNLLKRSQEIWYNECNETDWREAFTHHPRIGDIKSLAEKFASTMHLAGDEQGAIAHASAGVITDLAAANADYENKFGFIFIVCATGKTASEMLRLLRDRSKNTIAEELQIAMGEQAKITALRLQKIFDGETKKNGSGSQLTTHVLDTSVGKPGKDITVRLRKLSKDSWQTFAQGVTNEDGRISDLLPPERTLVPGTYKIVFETGLYFEAGKIKGFYPEVEIQFTVFDDRHYHVPLLINPFGYSTYRGS